MVELTVSCLAQTQSIAKQLALALAKKVTKSTQQSLFLIGDQGVGKTAFCQSFVRALCGDILVKSPTYELFNIYKSSLGLTINHADFYRIEDSTELEAFDFYSCFVPKSITLIEWPEKMASALAPPDIVIKIETVDENVRKFFIEQLSEDNLDIQWLMQ